MHSSRAPGTKLTQQAVGCLLFSIPCLLLLAACQLSQRQAANAQLLTPPPTTQALIPSFTPTFPMDDHPPTPTHQPTNTPQPVIDTSNWLTFTDKSSFSVQFPPTWKTKTDPEVIQVDEKPIVLLYEEPFKRYPNNGLGLRYPAHYVGITYIPSTQTPQQYLEELLPNSLGKSQRDNLLKEMNPQPFSRGNISGIEYKEIGAGGRGKIMLISNGKTLFFLTRAVNEAREDNPPDDPTINQILATFRFTN